MVRIQDFEPGESADSRHGVRSRCAASSGGYRHHVRQVIEQFREVRGCERASHMLPVREAGRRMTVAASNVAHKGYRLNGPPAANMAVGEVDCQPDVRLLGSGACARATSIWLTRMEIVTIGAVVRLRPTAGHRSLRYNRRGCRHVVAPCCRNMLAHEGRRFLDTL